jgi:hypothetical protein
MQTAKKAIQKGRRKEGAPLQSPTRLTRLTINAHIGGRQSPREIRLEEGTNRSREPARRWDPEQGPYKTDDVTRADLGTAQPVTGGGQRVVTK